MSIKVIAPSKKPGTRPDASGCPWVVEDVNGATHRQPQR
jgi:hypothetical protein